MADISSHQNNEHVQKLLVAVLTNPQTGWTGPSAVAGAGGRGVGVAAKGASMPARTPKPSQ